jgi:hypothetical protein
MLVEKLQRLFPVKVYSIETVTFLFLQKKKDPSIEGGSSSANSSAD